VTPALRIPAFAALLIAFSGCGCSPVGGSASTESEAADASADAPIEASEVDPQDVEEPVFEGCTEDCSGHEAGFLWAQDNDISDESDCGGNSQSFIEGCEQFVQERQALAEASSEDAVSDAEGSE